MDTSIENIEKLYKNSWQDIYSLKLTEPKTLNWIRLPN